MIIVTGGAGFIGSQIVRALNERGRSDVLVVDDMVDGRKIQNLAERDVYDVVDKDAFLAWLTANRSMGEPIDAIVHQGACSDTTEWNGREILRINYEYSKSVLQYCTAAQIPLVYASSASVYGGGRTFVEDRKYERPLNPYAYSKFLFDALVRRIGANAQSQIVGLRYFNVYGPGEAHKDQMASVAYKMWREMRENDGHHVTLFGETDGYARGEQMRDFVYVEDCARANLWFLDHPDRSGIFNLGTGRARTFNELAGAVLAHFGSGEIEYVDLPEKLRGAYQSYTQADLSNLEAAGYDGTFTSLEDGVARYLEWLDQEG